MLVGLRSRAGQILATGCVLVVLVGCSAAQVPATNSLSSPVVVPTIARPTNSLSAPVSVSTPRETSKPTQVPTESPIPTVAPSTSPSASPSLDVNGFPVEIGGLPVISVAEVDRLLDAGKLAGRVVAIAAYFSYNIHSCPSDAFTDDPLLRSPSCTAVGFADTAADAHVCHSIRNGVTCQSGPEMVPIGVPETTGRVPHDSDPDDFYAPSRIVVLAHSDDARQWQCTSSVEVMCKRALVADRFVWADGSTLTPDEPELWDPWGMRQFPLRMTVEDVQAAIGTDEVIVAVPFQAKSIWSVDPRWNLAGDETVWLVRSVPADSDLSDTTRAVQVSLVDDTTGQIIDSHDLALDPDYAPGRLRLGSERLDFDALGNDPNELVSFYRVTSSTGAVVHDRGEFWPDPPILLPAGDYAVESWLATYIDGVPGLPTRSCTTNVHLDALAEASLHATYDHDHECAWTTSSPP